MRPLHESVPERIRRVCGGRMKRAVPEPLVFRAVLYLLLLLSIVVAGITIFANLPEVLY